MKKFFVVLLALLVCVALPLMAQEKKMDKKEMPAMPEAPPPLDDDFMKWMVGEWEGWSESPMGKSKEWESVEMALNEQFLLRRVKSEQGEMVYKGLGGTTMNPESGEFMGYWMDSFRGMYQGKGKLEGEKLTMEWTGHQGTYKQITEKISDDKYTYSWSFTDPAGNTTEGKGEMTRVKKMTGKNY